MKKKLKKGRVEKALDKSFINYFSDLFIVVMVLAWIIVIAIMIPVAIYATVFLIDTSIWSYVAELVGIPLSAGGAIWMIKNSVQHAMANKNGKQAKMDFPRVDTEDLENEEPIDLNESADSGESEEFG